MNNDIIHYGGWVKLNQPLGVFTIYKMPLSNQYKWLGIDTMKVKVPLLAKKITLMRELDVDLLGGTEIFLINKHGHLIDLPEKIKTKKDFFVNDILMLVILPGVYTTQAKAMIEEYSKLELSVEELEKVLKRAFTTWGFAEEYCQKSFTYEGDESCDAKQILKEHLGANLIYWTTNVTQEELKFKAQEEAKEHLDKLAFLDQQIEGHLETAVLGITTGLNYPKAYGFTGEDAIEKLLENKCKELWDNVQNIFLDFSKYAVEEKISIHLTKQKYFDLEKALCTELKKRIGEYIANNANWLKDKGKSVVSNFFCGWTKLCK